ncbi:glycosyltransferase family 2 protein [Caldifermentibacillus hisashii]|uniref:glycosyltransferase family 2 protein n=1 Tax=Caldifermentibacillus hisashii TaxID=996558 RepID=UPI0030D669C0
MGENLISVIIPTYNRGHMIHVSIESVINQSYKNLELIIVDDNSEDNTKEIVEEYMKKDKRIKYIKHDVNKGGAAARNTGIFNATGDYIAFLDSDDEWYPKKLEKQIKVIQENNNIDLVFTAYKVMEKYSNKLIGYHKIKKNYRLSQLYKNNFLGSTSSLLIKKQKLIEVNGFDDKLKSCQDWDLYLKCCDSSNFYVIDEPLLTQYYHGNRISNNNDAIIQGHKAIIKKILRILQRKKYPKMETNMILSELYLRMSKLYFKNNNFEQGKRFLFISMKLYPLNIKTLFYVINSLFGKKVFMYIYNKYNKVCQDLSFVFKK